MTKITIFKKKGMICGFQVKGHSGYAESGSDIVCSGISTATQMTLAGLKEVLKLKVKDDVKDAYMQVLLDEFDNEKAQALLSAMQITLESITKEYARYVKMEVKEDVY